MLISLDYDDTFTADPKLWTKFVKSAQKVGHKVICITARDFTEGNKYELELALPDIPIIFCDMKPKRKVAESHGYDIDVWIDDTPEAITEGY